MKLYSRSVLKDKRSKELGNKDHWATLEDSVAFYNNPETDKKAALEQTYGYLNTEQFNLTQGMIAEVHTYSDKPVLPPGQSDPMFGKIRIGTANTQNMLNRMSSLLNEAIFDIFVAVKSVQEATYSYVAGGMQEDTRAEEAIDASNSIISKTRELQTTKDK